MRKKQNLSHITTLISRATEIKGDLHFSGTLEVEGRIAGNVIADAESSAEVRIRESGQVCGEIRVPRIIINGQVEGDVHAGEHLELAAKARVKGNVYYASMEMVMGAEVNGSLHRDEGKEIRRLGVDRRDEAEESLSKNGATV